MTQLGEAVQIGMIVSEDSEHSEATCPWHQKKAGGSAKAMEEQAPDEDTHGAIPDNLGTKLGENLNNAGNKPPKAGHVWVAYAAGSTVAYKEGAKRKRVQTYQEDDEYIYEYPLQYAPHHLIPGNESLKGSKIVPYMGDNSVIAGYRKGQETKLKKGETINYDVNHANNGVWLPSPYALSNSNNWPALPGIQAIKQRKGTTLADQTEGFKRAYSAAAIEASGGRQFHMRHVDYSNHVRKILDAMADKLKILARKCPKAKDSEEDRKHNAPAALRNRLDALSARLDALLTGPLWRSPLFTDELSKEYLADMKEVRRSSRGLRVL